MTDIRQLGPPDRAGLRALRALSLATDGEAFGRTAAEEAAMARIGIEDALDHCGPATFALGAFSASGTMVGMAVAFQGQPLKLRHRATINAVYVDRLARGRGVGRAIMGHVLDRLRAAGLHAAVLSVIAEPTDGRRFHEALGFAAYGIEPEGMRLGARSWDLVLMRRDLRA